MTRAFRYDVLRLDGIQRTPQGFLQIPATLTRTGIFEYKRADGTTTKEYRPAEEVFHKDAMASFANAPLTIGHVGQVSPDNWGSVSVGHVIGVPKQDGDFLSADCVVARGDAIRQVQDKALSELSCGYEVDIDPTPGTYQGQHYDSIQRKILGNHVALLPAGAGRAGPDVRLRADSKDIADVAVRYDTGEPATAHVNEENEEDVEKAHKDGRLSDAKYQEILARRNKPAIGAKNKDSIDAYPPAVDTTNQAAAPATPPPAPVAPPPEKQKIPREVLNGRIDALTAENTELKKRLDAVPALIEKASQERSALLAQVTPHMGKEWKADGKSSDDIVKDALTALRPEMKLDGKNTDYIRGAYEQAILTADESRSNVGSMQSPLHPMFRRDGDADIDALEKKNKASKQKSQDAWKTPPKGAITRDCLRK